MRTKVFQDFDAFAESVRGVDSRMMLRNAERRLWRTTGVDLGGVDIQLGQLGSGNIAQGELRSDGFMCYLPLTEEVEYTVNGSIMDRGKFAILEPGCEFCISTKEAHDWCVAFVPTEQIVDVEDYDLTGQGTCRLSRRDDQAAHRFRTAIGNILTSAANAPEFESSIAATHAADEVLKIASSVIGPARSQESRSEGRPKVAREEIIRRSLKLLETCGESPVTVLDLASAADVSERTLRAAFNEYFGVGPVRYLHLRQLHQVRHALRLADPEDVTISRVLADHGIWAFSRFASRYRQLFDELPSETLRANT